MSSSAIQLSSSVCVQVHVDGGVLVGTRVAWNPRRLGRQRGVQGYAQVERCLRTGDDIDGGDGRGSVDAAHARGNRGVLVCGHIDDEALGGVVGQVGVGSLAMPVSEGLSKRRAPPRA